MMFTPQRKKGWAGWSGSPTVSNSQENVRPAPRTNSRSSAGVIPSRIKGSTEAEATPVPPRLAGPEHGNALVDGSGLSEGSRRFKESEFVRNDSEALSKRVFELERERDECLYNMGILLIEAKEWSPKIEELKLALLESQELFKREQEAHNIALSDLEKREQDYKNALGVEKQCVIDLEKALHEMRAEIAETKFTSEKKLSDAHALEAKLEEKKMEIEAKVHAANAKLAEGNRKNSEMARKLEDLEAREYKLQRDLSSLNLERKSLDADFSKQREHLLEWENELQEKQRWLLNEQRLLNEREERANEMDRNLSKKQEEIEEARKKIDASGSSLKIQEDDFKTRLRGLVVKERDIGIKCSNLETKENDLMELEKKLITRESEEVQKLLEEHSATLDAKKHEFELEMSTKRTSFDEDVRSHMDMLDKQKRHVRCTEEQLIKKEKELENKLNNINDKENCLETKSKALKELEDSLKMDENKLQEGKIQLLKDSSELEAFRAKLNEEKAAVDAAGQKVALEKENLKITQQEREHHIKLQASLKMEKEECRALMDALEKEKEVLRKERETFEREWEVLDEKRNALEVEVKQLSDEREKFSKWRRYEEEKLKNESFQVKTDTQNELEELRLKKEAFERKMAQDRAEIEAEVDRKHADMTREFELLKHELEMNAQRRQDDAEKKLREKDIAFEKWREEELSNIKSSKEENDFKLKKLEMQQNLLQKEKDEFSDQRRKIDEDRREIRNDVDTLFKLNRSLKDQRLRFAKEKELFLSVVEQCKTCHNCGVPINKIDLDLLSSRDSEGSEEVLLPSLADGFLEQHIKDPSTLLTLGSPAVGSTNSGSHITQWFKKCASLFKLSSPKNVHPPIGDGLETAFGERIDQAASEEKADDFFENQVNLDSDNVVGETNRVDKTGEEAEASFGLGDNSTDVTRKSAVANDDETNEMQGSSIHAENESQPEPSKLRHRVQPSQRGKMNPIRRTRSVKAVIEDAKAIFGENYELNIEEEQNGDANKSQSFLEESQGGSVKVDQAVAGERRKRSVSDLEPQDSEAHSESISLEGHAKRLKNTSAVAPGDKRYNLRRTSARLGEFGPEGSDAHSERISIRGGPKRRQTPSLPPPGDKRYNLRHSTVVSTSAASKDASHNEEANEERISHSYPQSTGAIESSVNLTEKSGAVPNVPEVNSRKIAQSVQSAQSSEQSAENREVEDGAASTDTEDATSNEEDENEKKRTASIGKKLWHFLTT